LTEPLTAAAATSDRPLLTHRKRRIALRCRKTLPVQFGGVKIDLWKIFPAHLLRHPDAAVAPDECQGW
jgi:hypothetical protein